MALIRNVMNGVMDQRQQADGGVMVPGDAEDPRMYEPAYGAPAIPQYNAGFVDQLWGAVNQGYYQPVAPAQNGGEGQDMSPVGQAAVQGAHAQESLWHQREAEDRSNGYLPPGITRQGLIAQARQQAPQMQHQTNFGSMGGSSPHDHAAIERSIRQKNPHGGGIYEDDRGRHLKDQNGNTVEFQPWIVNGSPNQRKTQADLDREQQGTQIRLGNVNGRVQEV